MILIKSVSWLKMIENLSDFLYIVKKTLYTAT